MLRISTLLLRESCRLLVKNFGAKLSFKKTNLSFFMKKRKVYDITFAFFNSSPYGTESYIQHPHIRACLTALLDLVVLLSNEAVIVLG